MKRVFASLLPAILMLLSGCKLFDGDCYWDTIENSIYDLKNKNREISLKIQLQEEYIAKTRDSYSLLKTKTMQPIRELLEGLEDVYNPRVFPPLFIPDSLPWVEVNITDQGRLPITHRSQNWKEDIIPDNPTSENFDETTARAILPSFNWDALSPLSIEIPGGLLPPSIEQADGSHGELLTNRYSVCNPANGPLTLIYHPLNGLVLRELNTYLATICELPVHRIKVTSSGFNEKELWVRLPVWKKTIQLEFAGTIPQTAAYQDEIDSLIGELDANRKEWGGYLQTLNGSIHSKEYSVCWGKLNQTINECVIDKQSDQLKSRGAEDTYKCSTQATQAQILDECKKKVWENGEESLYSLPDVTTHLNEDTIEGRGAIACFGQAKAGYEARHDSIWY